MDSLLQVNLLFLFADWALLAYEFGYVAIQALPGVLSADGIDGFPDSPMTASVVHFIHTHSKPWGTDDSNVTRVCEGLFGVLDFCL